MSFRPLTYRKIFVDSKYRSSDSRSTSDVKIELQESFEIPDGTILQVHEVAVANVFHTIEVGVNNRLYFITFDNSGTKTGQYSAEFSLSYNLTPQELAEAVANKMSEAYGTADTFTGVYQPAINNIQLKATNGPDFKILTNKELNAGYEGFWDENSNSFSTAERWNISETIGNFEYAKATVGNVKSGNLINFLLYSNIYISCPELSNNNFHSPSAYSNAIIKKVPVNVPFAGIIHDQGVSEYDYVNCSRRTISRLTFRITDELGNTLNLHGINISFSLLFHNLDMR